MKFAKLFEVEDSQVLYTKEFDNNKGTVSIDVVMHINVGNTPVKATVSMEFDDESKRDEGFDKVDQDMAEKFYIGITNQFS